MKIEDDLKELERTLTRMKRREKIPVSLRREEIRLRLVPKYSTIKLSTFRTRIGWIGVAFNERGIVALKLPRGSRAESMSSLKSEFVDAEILAQPPDKILREITEYVEGRRRTFDLKLDWSSLKPFQRAVLEAANKIPFGETRSYAWIAQQIGNPRASRAVGQALGANPIPIILPCHRIIASNGSLGGYGGGLPLKVKLLKLEGAILNL
ncbi:MAG: methylated-DNA--[protein]-cysteine S-methyltransferase [Chloroflexi bacterium]|nr:methylated-DNA--[protein]-cysteine S-methyltransferase [Chloroflexota bacterium]